VSFTTPETFQAPNRVSQWRANVSEAFSLPTFTGMKKETGRSRYLSKQMT